MIVEKFGILLISIILMIMLSIKYIKRYYPANLFFISFMSFINAIYTYLSIYNIYISPYISLFIYFFTIIIPLFLVILQYNNIILKKQITYYIMKYLFKTKEYDKAIKYITKLVTMYGRTNEYMYILGECYKNKNDYINARDSFAFAIELNPNDYLSCYELGLILDETNKKEVACAMFSKALKINPDFYEAAEALGISLTSQGKFKKAIHVYRKILTKFSKSYELYYNIGMLEAEMGEYENAIDDFKKCVELKQNLFMAYHHIGKLCLALNRYDEAIEAYKKITNSTIYGAKAYFRLATIFAEKEEYEKSMANLEYAIELDETFINEISNEYSFNNMRKEINNFLEKRKLLIEKKKSSKNFLLNKFTLLKRSNNVNIKIS